MGLLINPQRRLPVRDSPLLPSAKSIGRTARGISSAQARSNDHGNGGNGGNGSSSSSSAPDVSDDDCVDLLLELIDSRLIDYAARDSWLKTARGCYVRGCYVRGCSARPMSFVYLALTFRSYVRQVLQSRILLKALLPSPRKPDVIRMNSQQRTSHYWYYDNGVRPP
jgi:hypothetical protein